MLVITRGSHEVHQGLFQRLPLISKEHVGEVVHRAVARTSFIQPIGFEGRAVAAVHRLGQHQTTA